MRDKWFKQFKNPTKSVFQFLCKYKALYCSLGISETVKLKIAKETSKRGQIPGPRPMSNQMLLSPERPIRG